MSDDIVKRLRIKAGVMEMGEQIAWGSDTALMREAEHVIEALRKNNDAASDVFEALKQAVLWLEDNRFGDGYINEQWYHDARAAIAKARGDDK